MVLLQVTKPPGMASGKTVVFPVCGGIVMSSGRVLCNGGIYRTDPSFVTASLLGMYLKEPCAGRCVSHTAELLADRKLVKKGEDPKWIEWTIDCKGVDMIRNICMVKPATGRKVDCYFTTGHVRRFDMAPFLGKGCGPAFRPLRDRATFLRTMTVMNGTLAFDIAGNRDDTKCVDIAPETIFEEGKEVKVAIA